MKNNNETFEQRELDLHVEGVMYEDEHHRFINEMGYYEPERPDFIDEMIKQHPKGEYKDYLVGMLENRTDLRNTRCTITNDFTIYIIPKEDICKVKDAQTVRKIKFYSRIHKFKSTPEYYYTGFLATEDFVEGYGRYILNGPDPLNHLEDVITKFGDEDDLKCFNRFRTNQ